MEEIEAKFKVEDFEKVKNKLRELNAVLIGVKKQRDIYFNHSKKDSLRNTPTYLRIRTEDDKSFVAMHYKLDSYRWEEIETGVDDGEKIKEIYKNLGFEIDIEVIKIRESYKIPDGEITLDDIKGLGTFIEIEVKSKDNLIRYCNEFGFELWIKDALETIPPWERKIMSRLIFDQKSVPSDEILNFFRKRYQGHEKLAFHYLWEDLFWRRKDEHIEWLEDEIRL